MYYSTKTYGTDRGLSCCFRQWRADHSHCQFLHGYSIGIKLIFSSETLDDKNWVYDFGGLKEFKSWADRMFDHTLIIAEDDPQLKTFKQLAAVSNGKESGSCIGDQVLCDLRIVPGVGCEMFARLAYDAMNNILQHAQANPSSTRYPVNPDVKLVSVEVFEHGANSAIYQG